jgi:predicted PurR-regulated permease PerM
MTGPSGDSPRTLIVWTLAMTVLTVILVWTAYLVRDVLLLVYVSVLFAIGFSPLVRLIERLRLLRPIGRRRVPRWLAILAIYLVMIGGVAVIALTIIPPMVQQGRDLGKAFPGLVSRLQDRLIEFRVIDHKVTWQELVQQAPTPSGSAFGGAFDTIFSAVTNIVGGLFGLFTLLILTFYLLTYADELLKGLLQLFPRERRGRVEFICREITVKVSAWLMGQLLLGAVIGTTAGIGLWLIGIPYFYVLALVSGIGELIPMVGPILAAIPAVAVAFTVSPLAALWVILFFIAQQQLENHVLVPKIMSRQVGVSPVTVIIALLMGGSLLGIIGALLAVPTAAILQVLFQELIARRDALDATLPD